jgi:hypothetical protein
VSASGPNPQSGRAELTRKSVVILFTLGAIMLVVPVGTVLSESSLCRANSSSCIHSEDYGDLVSFFPYVMLGGGMLIGFNMKRVSDSINSHQSRDDGRDEDEDSLTS